MGVKVFSVRVDGLCSWQRSREGSQWESEGFADKEVKGAHSKSRGVSQWGGDRGRRAKRLASGRGEGTDGHDESLRNTQ